MLTCFFVFINPLSLSFFTSETPLSEGRAKLRKRVSFSRCRGYRYRGYP